MFPIFQWTNQNQKGKLISAADGAEKADAADAAAAAVPSPRGSISGQSER